MTHEERLKWIYAPITMHYVQPKIWAGALISKGAGMEGEFTLQNPRPGRRLGVSARKHTEGDRDWSSRNHD